MGSSMESGLDYRHRDSVYVKTHISNRRKDWGYSVSQGWKHWEGNRTKENISEISEWCKIEYSRWLSERYYGNKFYIILQDLGSWNSEETGTQS